MHAGHDIGVKFNKPIPDPDEEIEEEDGEEGGLGSELTMSQMGGDRLQYGDRRNCVIVGSVPFVQQTHIIAHGKQCIS